jgi:hypothetical protein
MNEKKNNNESNGDGKKKYNQAEAEKLYALLELEGMTGTDPEGFRTVILYIDGDVKSQRLFGLN